MSVVSNRNTSSSESAIALKSLGKRVERKPLSWFSMGGRLTPTLKRESMAVKLGNPSSESKIAVCKDGTSACNTEYIVFAENVSLFSSEKLSSRGTYAVPLLLFSDNGSVRTNQPIVH